MIDVQVVNRKSRVLTPSGLACLRHLATINLTAGCAHDCLYCYIRGYRSYPGETRVTLYGDTLERLRAEWRRKRSRVTAVYFSPSSDLFQPVPEVLDMAYAVLEFLLASGVQVAFLTKGVIPARHMRLLAAHAPLVWAEIGLITLDDIVQRLFEPAAARPSRRLTQIGDLIRKGVKTEVRIDPIIPGFTDAAPTLRALIAAVAAAGVRCIAASTLFLRPAIVASLRKRLPPDQFMKLISAYTVTERVGLHAHDGSIRVLPLQRRREIYDRVRCIAGEFGIETKVCACKNPDLAQGSCGIAGPSPLPTSAAIPPLFQLRT